MKIAIMQPYFIPYPGYFRLFCAADLFVVYDCVQFPRRSWVHRNQLIAQNKELAWLTLPLQKQPMDVCIKDLKFRETADWKNQLTRFKAVNILKTKYPSIYQAMATLASTPVEYLMNLLREICKVINIPFNIAYSAPLAIPSEIKAKNRILTIVKHYNASNYVNVSGGRDLYSIEEFKEAGVNLHFLPEYKGEYQSIIEYLVLYEPLQLKEILLSQSLL